MVLLLGAFAALLLGAMLLRISQRQRQVMGIPNGDVFYQDHDGQPMRAETLTSNRWNLRGRPDCLIRNADEIIPVELKKPARPPARGGVYPNHLIQVLAYIVLVREHYGEEAPYGLVLYGEHEARKVYPAPENLAWLESVCGDVRAARKADRVDRSNRQVSRCRGCGMRESCGQSLVTSIAGATS